MVSVYNAGIISNYNAIVQMTNELYISESMKGCRHGLIEAMSCLSHPPGIFLKGLREVQRNSSGDFVSVPRSKPDSLHHYR
jgi:hypothetical protein